MEKIIQDYIQYLHTVKRVSQNTEMSYQGDLKNAVEYFAEQGITDPLQISAVNLNSYMIWMEKENLSAATVARRIAAIRSFFHYLRKNNLISEDPAEELKPPKVEKKAPVILNAEEVDLLLNQPDGQTLKGIRDRAMLELLYATGIRVSELIALEISDVELKRGYIVCRRDIKERWISFDDSANKALTLYLEHAREILLKGKESNLLFCNCSGGAMSRQGFWKLLKGYVKSAGIEADITPQTLRHSFAMHLLQKGTDLRNVQELLGHSDLSTTVLYAQINRERIGKLYND